MKEVCSLNINKNCLKSDKGWCVRCPHEQNYGFISAELCHQCFIDAMALNNKQHKGHNCKEGMFYRNQRAEGYLI